MACYLLHFDKPYQHARHYLGFVDTASHSLEEALISRMTFHRSGRGSKLLRAVSAAEIDWRIVRVWPDATRSDERKLKVKGSTRLCPVCNPNYERNGKLLGSLTGAALAEMA